MYKEKTVAVVVPAYNEELLISRVVDTMPDYVDHMYIVNDGSQDQTLTILNAFADHDPRIIVVDHEENKGLGQSLIDGYIASLKGEADVIAVMAGDAQMNPNDLAQVISPILDGDADYVKGNRLLREEVVERMPKHRLYGNAGLTLLTKFATGYWKSIDPQCGYTAISQEALRHIPIATMIKGYGYNAHILHMLNLSNFRVAEVEVEPVYGEEQSKIKLRTYIPSVSKLLVRLFFKRIINKFLVRDFHPLVFFYMFSFASGAISLGLFARLAFLYTELGYLAGTTLLLFSFSTTNALFSAFFAMWMDMDVNNELVSKPHTKRSPDATRTQPKHHNPVP